MADLITFGQICDNPKRLYIQITLVVVVVCFLVLLLTPGYDLASRPFWHRIVGVAFVTIAGLIVFTESLRIREGRLKLSSGASELGPGF
jgi:hypothetical protein